jgi:hypothetical protein
VRQQLPQIGDKLLASVSVQQKKIRFGAERWIKQTQRRKQITILRPPVASQSRKLERPH